MKITNRQLRRIIKETIIKEMKISISDAEQYLRDNAATYREDPKMSGSSLKMLLMDDFMDNLGHQHDIEGFQDLIDELSLESQSGAEDNEADEKFSWGIDPKRYHKLRKDATDRRRQALSHLPGGNKE